MRVLIVEDDAAIAEALAEGLRLHGYEPDCTDSGEAAIARAATADLVLLDLGLPDLDGMEVCRRLREASADMPIIIVSARGEELDRVLGLELGADDYVVKPFSLRELVARVQVHARRLHRLRSAGAPEAAPTPEGVQQLGALAIDRRRRRVTVDAREVELTAKEFDLLSVLAEDPGAVVRREDLMERVWDTNWFGSTKTLDVHVASLRRKLGDAGWVETVRGVGFRTARVR